MSSGYDSTYETNHSDSSDFAQNEEDREGHTKACGTFPSPALALAALIPAEVNTASAGEIDFLALQFSLGR